MLTNNDAIDTLMRKRTRSRFALTRRGETMLMTNETNANAGHTSTLHKLSICASRAKRFRYEVKLGNNA